MKETKDLLFFNTIVKLNNAVFIMGPINYKCERCMVVGITDKAIGQCGSIHVENFEPARPICMCEALIR
jgi:hypothetical protein